MKFNATQIPYHATGLFSQLVRDYVEAKQSSLHFVEYAPGIEGVQKAIEARKGFKVNRPLLVEVLKAQYTQLPSTKAVNDNVNALLAENTFVVTTSHQPNIFTGPLYFFYKIIHLICDLSTVIDFLEVLELQWSNASFRPSALHSIGFNGILGHDLKKPLISLEGTFAVRVTSTG
jgi:hypothetical protein